MKFPKELKKKSLSHSALPLLSHIRTPRCWKEARGRITIPVTCATQPGTVKKWNSEANGHIRIYPPTKSQPYQCAYETRLGGDLIVLEIEK